MPYMKNPRDESHAFPLQSVKVVDDSILIIMTKPSRTADQKPVIPPRRKSLAGTRKQSKNPTLNFPASHQLIITTPKKIFIWSRHGITPIFESGSRGIVAARKTAAGGGLLAVADSHIVLLHDMKKWNERRYKLKGSDVRVER